MRSAIQVKDEAKTLLGKLASSKDGEGGNNADTTRHEELDMDISANEESSTPHPTTPSAAAGESAAAI